MFDGINGVAERQAMEGMQWETKALCFWHATLYLGYIILFIIA
jgi:hypothetical protein